MTRSQLIQKMKDENPGISQGDIEAAVSLIFEVVSDALEKGRRVELRGFGAFSVRNRERRIGRNPRTGEMVEIEADAVPFFRPGKELRKHINGGVDP